MASPLLAMSPSMAGAATGRVTPETARRIGEEFELVFLSSMMEHMFSGLETDGPFGGGQAESTYRSLLIEEYGKSIAASGGVGIADEVSRELLAFQEMTPNEH